MTPSPDDLVRRWDSLTAEEETFIRQAEVYAAYLAYTDHEIGRVIQAVEDMGKLDNTLIVLSAATMATAPKDHQTARPMRCCNSTESNCRFPSR